MKEYVTSHYDGPMLPRRFPENCGKQTKITDVSMDSNNNRKYRVAADKGYYWWTDGVFVKEDE